MSKKDVLLLNPGMFIAETRILSTNETGAYAQLVMMWWQNGKALPNNDIALARVAGLSAGVWKKVKRELARLNFIAEDDGEITLPRWDRIIYVPKRVSLVPTIRALVFERDGENCGYCGATEGPFHIDHIEPVARGGQDDLENLIVACRDCNLSKGAKTPEEWLQ